MGQRESPAHIGGGGKGEAHLAQQHESY